MLSFKGTHVNYTRIVILNYAHIVATEKSSLITRFFFEDQNNASLYFSSNQSLLIRYYILFIWGDLYTFIVYTYYSSTDQTIDVRTKSAAGC